MWEREREREMKALRAKVKGFGVLGNLPNSDLNPRDETKSFRERESAKSIDRGGRERG